MNKQDKEFIDAGHVYDVMGVPHAFVQQEIDAGRLPAIKASKRTLVRVTDLKAAIQRALEEHSAECKRRHASTMNTNQAAPVPLGAMARQVRVPAKWLREEAEAGRIPHLKAGMSLLFDPQTVERIVLERTRGAVTGSTEVIRAK